jgi:hypothetical protein
MLNEHDLKDMAPEKPEPNRMLITSDGDVVSKYYDPNYDPVNHPKHYTRHPSGIECIQITQHMGFNLGNALKYIWRCDLKLDAIEDLKKAKWYIDKELEKRTNANDPT